MEQCLLRARLKRGIDLADDIVVVVLVLAAAALLLGFWVFLFVGRMDGGVV